MKYIIWTYWSGTKDSIYNECQFSWRDKLRYSRWVVKRLNPTNIHKYGLDLPTNFNSLIPAHQSDVVRLGLLYKYGGIWMDSTIYLNRGLDWVLNEVDVTSTDYYMCKWDYLNYPENWMIVCPKPLNENILKWRNALLETIEVYPNVTSTKYYSDFKSITVDDNYFMMYQIYGYLIHKDKTFKKSCVLSPMYWVFIPLQLPLDFDPRPFIKYTGDGRRKKYIYKWISIVVMCVVYFKVRLMSLD
jgi:hypothetical protein|uniref:Glycosyltransferase n=1 Tax=viral metagenome TaxID=1070528 RepID=A0A6C0LWE9_9ZZZZ